MALVIASVVALSVVAPAMPAHAQEENPPSVENYADLIARMYEWRDDPVWGRYKSHTDRWDRALLALGETVTDTTLTPLTAAEAQVFVDRGWTRWVDVVTALEDIESRDQQQSVINGAPTVSDAIADATIVSESGTLQVSLSGVFSDADSDPLTVSADSSDEAVATVAVATDGTALTVTGAGRGTASVTVTADDGKGGTVSDAFAVTVKAAPVVASPLADVSELAVGDTHDVSLTGVFSDADSDPLTVSADSSDQAVATVAVASDGSTLTVTAVSQGSATITVTADDSDSNQVADTLDVTVAAAQPQEQYADLITQMREWRNDPRYVSDKSHTDRWDRALMALGETVADTTLIPMTAAEAQQLVDRGWTRWVDVADALATMPTRRQWVYRFIESNVIEKYEDEHPWLRETWDGMEREGNEVVLRPLPAYTIMQVRPCRDAPGQTITIFRCSRYDLEVDPKYARYVRGYVHELAHFWTLNLGVVDEPIASIAMGHLYYDHLKRSTGCHAPATELYAEAITYAVVGAIHSPYWCSGLPPLHSDEVQNVANSVLQKRTPQWFIDEYQNQNGSWKLEELWTDIKSLDTNGDMQGMAFHLSNSFGGYCSRNHLTIFKLRNSISIPWRDGSGGSCRPSAPDNAAITPGDSQLTLSWDTPDSDGGAYIRQYWLEWWTGTRWDTAWTDGTSYTITGLNNGQRYTVNVRALTFFTHDGPTATVSGTPTATPTVATEPVVASAPADVSALEVGSTHDVSLAGVFSDADGDSLTITAASSDDAKATVSVASSGSKLTVEGVAEGTATITVTAQDDDGNRVSDTFDVAVVEAAEPPPTNRAPTVASALADVSNLEVDAASQVSLSGVFSDADGDSLTVTAVSSNTAVATVSQAPDGSALTLTGMAAGTATITVTARDTEGNQAHDRFTVTVTAPLPPPPVDDRDSEQIFDQYDVNGNGTIDVREYIEALRAKARGEVPPAAWKAILDSYLSST